MRGRVGRCLRHAVGVLALTAVSAVFGQASPERLGRDLHLLRRFSGELAAMEEEMVRLQASVGLRERGFYTSDEHAAIESLLFRYLLCREALWEIVDEYRGEGPPDRPASRTEAREIILGFNAALKLAHYTSRLVYTFLECPAVIGKLNEAYHPCNIPPGTYDRLFRSVTDVDNLCALRAAWEVFREDAGNPATSLYAVSISNPDYRELIRENYLFYQQADATVTAILEARSLLLPSVRNRLRHSELMALVDRSKAAFQDNLYAVRAILFNNVGRIRNPVAAGVVLTPADMARVRRLLRPGDLVLTFSSGYMSNIFLPGVFKHGILYVGGTRQRREQGLVPELFADVPQARRSQVLRHLEWERLEDSAEADLVEAVAEGVIFNSLDHVLGGHTQRAVVLRPRLSPADTVQALKTVFLYIDAGYDFRFDFNDATHLCCTEVIYRAINRRGPIELPLIERMGHPTLSADDILRQHLRRPGASFETVLLVRPGTDGRGVVVAGERAEAALRELMPGI
ncbi:MAG: hypothetical protein JXR77_13130 [Lentisphaeria bacterium]|nr:hypothetical protein [Lentisphaeria bacterium]